MGWLGMLPMRVLLLTYLCWNGQDKERSKAEGLEPLAVEAGVTPYIRPLNMADMRQAMDKVAFKSSKRLSPFIVPVVLNYWPYHHPILTVYKWQVRSSVASEAGSMLELQEWNEQYGEGGTRKKTTLSYFM